MASRALKTVEQEIEVRDEEARKRNIAQRINAAMGEVDYIQKERKNGMNYSIVSHDAVTAKVRPILHKHGIVYYPRDLRVVQNGNRTEAVFCVRFENIDNRADYIDVETIGYGVDPQDKGPGKAISYGVKYALLKVLGLETGDDPDEVQDARANHEPAQPVHIGAGEPKPKARVQFDGPYKSPTALKTACHEFAKTLENMGDMGELIAWEATKDYVEFVAQVERDAPQYWFGSDTMPAEFIPLAIRVANKRRELEELESIQ